MEIMWRWWAWNLTMPFPESFFSIELHFKLLSDNQNIWEQQMILPLSDAITFLPETINLCHWRRGKANKQQMKGRTSCSLLIQWHDRRETLSIQLHRVILMESWTIRLGNLLFIGCFGVGARGLFCKLCVVQHFNTEISALYLTLDTPECLTSLLNKLTASAVRDDSTREEEMSGEGTY